MRVYWFIIRSWADQETIIPEFGKPWNPRIVMFTEEQKRQSVELALRQSILNDYIPSVRAPSQYIYPPIVNQRDHSRGQALLGVFVPSNLRYSVSAV